MAANRELWAAAYRLYQEGINMLEAAQQDQLSAVFEKLAGEMSIISNKNGREGQLLSVAVYEMLEFYAKNRAESMKKNCS